MKHSLASRLFPPPQRFKPLSGHASSHRVRKKTAPLEGRPAGAYRLSVSRSGTTIAAAEPSGFFHAEQTLRQIDAIHPKGRPCLEIEDWPEFPVRGFYHDVTRGKVPTLETLLELAELCARHKLNHLQLYIEHTFAFRRHPEVWQCADPLTADEIRRLDKRCAELHIDLVPSFSTFGHFYTWIHHKFPELNELRRDVSRDPFCWRDRMAHYTLDCRNPRSLRLVREIIREVRPLFRSRYFNICADETFDLGTGRNKAEAKRVGRGRLYVDFLKAIMREVKKSGAVPMFWGDVIGSHPEFLDEIPKEAITLDWDYSEDISRSKAEVLKQSGRQFFVCPGIASWNHWLPDYRTAARNITRFARHGHRLGASGLLNTDWGDFGHIQTLGPSLPGIILGACAAWSPHSVDPGRMGPALSRHVWGNECDELLGLLEKAVSARRASWQVVCLVHQPRSRSIPAAWFDPASGLPRSLFKHSRRAHLNALSRIRSIRRVISPCVRKFDCRLMADEIRTGLLGLECMEEYFVVCQSMAAGKRSISVKPAAAAANFRTLAGRLERVWMQRNKPSEFHRIRTVLEAAASRLATAR